MLYDWPTDGVYVDPFVGAAGGSVSYAPGTLLCLAPKISPYRSQVSPAIFQMADIDPRFFPHVADVDFFFQEFDPTLSNLVPNNPSVNVAVGAVGAPPVNVEIIGHQLSPLPQPLLTGGVYAQFFPLSSVPTAGNPPQAPNPIPSDSYCLYQYGDFNKLFQRAS
jgi:hypothetical protein